LILFYLFLSFVSYQLYKFLRYLFTPNWHPYEYPSVVYPTSTTCIYRDTTSSSPPYHNSVTKEVIEDLEYSHPQ
jgi:hypothetical protein